MPAKNPFSDEDGSVKRANPFGDDGEGGSFADSLARIEHASRTVRRLKTQLGAEGLTLSATREMIDELSKALDATARALRDLADRG
jgi:flagellin-like hook-associated protein FlgL